MPRYRVWEDGEDRNNAVEIGADFASDAAECYAEEQDGDSLERYFGQGVTIFVAFGGTVAKYKVTASVTFDACEVD